MNKYLLSIVFLLIPVSSAGAQESGGQPTSPGEGVIADSIRDNAITVVASGLRDSLAATGQPVTIIGQDEIDAVQGGDIVRILAHAPGVAITRNGGPGAVTGLELRGADADQLLVVIDGVRVADPAAPGGGYDFGNLLPGTLGKIELLRGSNGTIWGSQAIGGVLVAETRTASGFDDSAEYGARDTAYLTAVAGLDKGPATASIDGSWYRTAGFSAAAAGTEPDGFRQWQAGGRASVAITPDVRLRGSLRYASARLDIDGYPPPDFTLTDTAEYQNTRQLSARAGIAYAHDGLQITGDWSSADTQRQSFDPTTGRAPTYSTDGVSDRIDLRGEWRSDKARLFFGGESEWTRFSTTLDARNSARIGGVYAQAGYTFGNVLTVNAGARLTDHNRFGTAVTFGGDAAYELGDGWRVRASLGEGFKAPTLFQLYSDYGNLALRPERSTSVDFGIERFDRNYPLYLSATVFRRDSEGLIDFVSCFGSTTGICTDRPFGTYDNVGRARAQGVELEGRYALDGNVTARVAYSYVDATDRTPRSPDFAHQLARRPRHTLSIGGEWETAVRGPTLGAALRWVSNSFDDAANTVLLRAYAVLDLTARWPINNKVELYGRVENVGNERYQTAAGYASPPRGAFLGARLRL
jgi:vitamin B12 transporter